MISCKAKEKNFMCVKKVIVFMLSFVLMGVLFSSGVWAASEENNTLGPYTVLEDTFKIYWRFDELGVSEEDVDRIDVQFYILEGDMYRKTQDYADVVSITVGTVNGVNVVMAEVYPKKSGNIWALIMADGELISRTPLIELKPFGAWAKIKKITGVMLVSPLKMLTVTQYKLINKEGIIPIPFIDTANISEENAIKFMTCGTLIGMVVVVILALILRKIQFNGETSPGVIFLTYLFCLSFTMAAIFILDKKKGYLDFSLGYTDFTKQVICIGYGIICLLAAIGLVLFIIKRKFGFKELISLILSEVITYIGFKFSVLMIITALIIGGSFFLLYIYKGVCESAYEAGYDPLANISDSSDEASDSAKNDSWYDKRKYVYDEDGNRLKVGTSGDYAEDASGEWHRVYRDGDGSPYIRNDSEKNDLH